MKPAALRELALGLPGTVEQPHFERASFRVQGKIYATLTPDGSELRVFVAADARERWCALQPAHLEPLPWGSKIVGLRVRLAGARASWLLPLLREAWAGKGGVARP